MRTSLATKLAASQTGADACLLPGCVSDHADDGPVCRHAGPPYVIAAFRDQPPLTVRAELDVYLLGSPLPTPAVVRVGGDVVTPAAARRMAAALVACADQAEQVTL